MNEMNVIVTEQRLLAVTFFCFRSIVDIVGFEVFNRGAMVLFFVFFFVF